MRPARHRLAFLSVAILTVLAAVLAIVLPAGTAPAGTAPAAETRVWALVARGQKLPADRLYRAQAFAARAWWRASMTRSCCFS
jgi:hypothetical protein